MVASFFPYQCLDCSLIYCKIICRMIVITYVVILSTDTATIERVSSSVSKSWIGQTVTLTCVSDGVPTPTLSWYNPEGTKFNSLQAKENTVDVTMNSVKDFGLYNCTANNGFVPASDTLRLHQISKWTLFFFTFYF